jgi:hypothetical protein
LLLRASRAGKRGVNFVCARAVPRSSFEAACLGRSASGG